MTQTKTSKRALLTSALSLLLCCTMLIGTTWAWFTDSVTSAGNKIQSGTLQVDLLVKGGNTDYTEYTSVKTDNKPIFNYDLWEPGYTLVTNAKVVNNGTLALKYTLKFVSEDDIASQKLAEVIDVFYASSEVSGIDSRTALNDKIADKTLKPLGTLKDVFTQGEAVVMNDNLEPKGKENCEDFATIVLKMKEEAGNEYQNQTISAFDIQLLATQWTYENDTFDNLYDDGLTPAENMVLQEKNGMVLGVTDDGDTVLIKNKADVTDQPVVIPEGVTVVGDYAFADQGMTSVTTPSTLKEIKPHAFESQSSAYATGKMTSLTLNEGLEKIGYRSFKAQKIVNLTIPNTVTDMKGAFYQCGDLQSVTFEPVSQVTDFTQAFAYCTSLTSITLPENLVIFGQDALRETAITSLTIPASVTTIGSQSLRQCNQLSDIYLNCSTTPTIANNTFTNCPQTITIHVANENVLNDLLTEKGMTEGVAKNNVWGAKIILVAAE